MLKRYRWIILLTAILGLAFAALLWFGRDTPIDPAFTDIARIVDSVRAASYPQLPGGEITVHGFHSDYVFFEARFTLSSYLLMRRLRFMILFNRDALARGVPADGLRAIVAHELAHIEYFQSESRMGLAGLIQLVSASFATLFERTADLRTIALGYGPGLQSYRKWLYRNVPPGRLEEKKRDYFSPDEIEAIMSAERQRPGIVQTFLRCVPLNRAQIEAEARNPAIACSD